MKNLMWNIFYYWPTLVGGIFLGSVTGFCVVYILHHPLPKITYWAAECPKGMVILPSGRGFVCVAGVEAKMVEKSE